MSTPNDVFSCIASSDPNDLRGCLDSYVRNAKQHGRDLRIVVVDPSLTAPNRNSSREALLLFCRANKVRIEYTSTRDIEVFLARAARYSWVDVDVLRYAILGDWQIGSGYGAACNVSRLLTGNSNLLVAGAATRCEIVSAPGGGTRMESRPDQGSGLLDSLFSDVEPITFFDSVVSTASLPKTPDEDLFGEVWKALEVFPAVSLGTWGDVGVGSPGFYLLSQQASSIAISDMTYAANRLNRIVHRSVRSPISGAVNFRTVAFGISPAVRIPFLPTEGICGGLAGQSLFGPMMRINGQQTVSIPLSVKNTPAQAFAFEDIADVPRRVSLVDFLATMASSVSSSSLSGLVSGLTEATMDSSFIAATVGSWGRYISDSAKARRGQVAGSPAMQADLDIVADAGLRVLDSHHRRSQAREQVIETILPIECRSGPCSSHRVPALFRQISQFGKLLIAWPDLVAAVADLDKNGVRLGAYI